jgi:hypothetical protein
LLDAGLKVVDTCFKLLNIETIQKLNDHDKQFKTVFTTHLKASAFWADRSFTLFEY